MFTVIVKMEKLKNKVPLHEEKKKKKKIFQLDVCCCQWGDLRGTRDTPTSTR